MTTTLVTGGAGFIGSHLIERLLRESNEQIVCLDNFNDYYSPDRKRRNVASFAADPRVMMAEVDLCDKAAVTGVLATHPINRVVHLGGYAGVRSSVKWPQVHHETNVNGTATLLESLRLRPLERFVFVSSSTVYGREAVAPFVEDAPLGVPASPYGASKQAAEQVCTRYWRKYGIPVVSLRLFSVYGPRLRPDLALSIFTEKLLRDEPLPLFGDGSIRRDFTHVDDICSGILAALSAPHVIGEAINLGHDEPVSIRELISHLERETGKTAQLDMQPAVPSDLTVTHADLTKALRLLLYQPRVALADGVRDYVAWHRANR